MPSLAHAAAPALTAGASRGNIARSSPLRAPRSRSAAPLASRAVRGATFDSDASCPPSVVARSFVAPRGVSRAAFSRPRPRRRSLASANDLDDAPAVAAGADALDDAPASSAESLDADAIVAEVLAAVADTDSGRDVTDEQREATDACIARLERIGATQVPRALENPKIFGDYDVSYVSTGKKQIGNPAGGRFRGGLGAALFRTIGLEQNIYEPNVVVNRVAFLVFGLIPGEVVLDGTFVPLTSDLIDEGGVATQSEDGVDAKKPGPPPSVVSEETKNAQSGDGPDASRRFVTKRELENVGVDDGMTIRAFFDPPRITLGGLPSFSVGPKSSVVLSTTYVDDAIRLGKGSRGSLFVFTRKTPERAERDRARWRVGGAGVSVMLACTVGLFAFAVQRFRAGGATELVVAAATATAASFAMALVMRQGGIVAEDADYDEKYEKAAEMARAKANAMREKSESERTREE